VALDTLRHVLGPEASGKDAKSLIDHWCLDRKLREAMQASGVPGDEAWRISGFVKAAIGLLDVIDPSRALGASAAVDECIADPDLRSLAGVNVYDDVTWFVKERFEFGVMAFALARVLAFEPAGKAAKPPLPGSRDASTLIPTVAESVELAVELVEAAASAGYRLDELGRILSYRNARERREPETARLAKAAKTANKDKTVKTPKTTASVTAAKAAKGAATVKTITSEKGAATVKAAKAVKTAKGDLAAKATKSVKGVKVAKAAKPAKGAASAKAAESVKGVKTVKAEKSAKGRGTAKVTKKTSANKGKKA